MTKPTPNTRKHRAQVVVLGLLLRGPSHGYQIAQALKGSWMGLWATVLPGSIYHALRGLGRQGLIRVDFSIRDSSPRGLPFCLSDKGRARLRELLEAELRSASKPYPYGLYLAIAFLVVIPRSQRFVLLAEALDCIAAELAQWCVEPETTSPFDVLIRSNARRHLELDRELLLKVVQLEVHSPDIDPTQPVVAGQS